VGGCSISFPGPAVAQLYAQAGFSFLYFDMEHSNLPIDGVSPICAAARLAGIVPIAGVSGIAEHLISRALDNGAMGVIVPHVSTAEEAALVVRACRYAPEGRRGLINLGWLTDFEAADSADWVKANNVETLVAVKVESALGIQNVDEIASVPGLNAILVGPGDLAASHGVPGETWHPKVRDGIERTLAACSRNGVAGGPHVDSVEALTEWADRGALFMSCAFDGELLLHAARRLMQETRASLGERLFQARLPSSL
jgi:2-keto-3-deoxy-L-rhamnonate aldolase RhmA